MREQGAGDHKDTVKLGVERFRAVRRELEASVLPLASSLDGRRFTFQASLHGLEVRLGGYVVVEHEDSSRLGQVLALEPARADGAEIDLPAEDETQAALRSSVAIRFARGEGALLEGDDAPFHDAMVRAATPDEVRGWTERARRRDAVLEIGELALSEGVPAGLDAGGFDRHTFLCGQSGSGKTYSLGVVLEQLLATTGLRIVVLDPNSDFVRLGTDQGGRRPGGRRALPAGGGHDRGPLRARDGRAAAADPPRGDRSRRPGGAAAPGPGRRSRGARRAQRAAGRGPPHDGRGDGRLRSGRSGSGSRCAPATSASSGSASGRAGSPARRSTRSAIPASAASSWTSGRSRPPTSRRWPPRRCSASCGAAGRSATRS